MRSMFISLQVLITALAVARATPVVSDVALPPILAHRVKAAKAPAFPGDLAAEQDAIKKNGALSKLIPQKAGMSLATANKNITLPTCSGENSTVTSATPSQIADLKIYAALESTAYCPSVISLRNWDCINCKTTVPDAKVITTFSTIIHDTCGFIIRSDVKKTIYLVFRGSVSIRSYATDMGFIATDYPPVKGGPKVHAGFYRSYEEAAPLLFPVIQDQLTKFPDYQIATLGHSLGGAHALLAALDIYQRDAQVTPKNICVITTGCPRVGNPDFAYYVNSTGIQFTRIVHKRDIVPHLPAEMFGFLHPGVENWIYDDLEDVRICGSSLDSRLCSNSIVPFTSLLDHMS
ncbi:hypothetical protein DFQ29_009889 [Apophysomyces sp. BC1021]|nr:hypothetical protein DFQ29_009889 [Apophysomyces sp. BC1021]